MCRAYLKETAAAAFCKAFAHVPSVSLSQLRKLRSGVFPLRSHNDWTVTDVQRPSLQEEPLVAQMGSSRGSLERRFQGTTTPSGMAIDIATWGGL